MTEIHTYIGFKLPCRICGVEHIVGECREFVEKKTNRKLTAYWHAEAVDGDKLIGISEGSGDTYECMPCHALKWVAETAAKEPSNG